MGARLFAKTRRRRDSCKLKGEMKLVVTYSLGLPHEVLRMKVFPKSGRIVLLVANGRKWHCDMFILR